MNKSKIPSHDPVAVLREALTEIAAKWKNHTTGDIAKRAVAETERAARTPASVGSIGGEVQTIWQYEYLNSDGWHTAYDYDAPTVSDRIRNIVKFTSEDTKGKT